MCATHQEVRREGGNARQDSNEAKGIYERAENPVLPTIGALAARCGRLYSQASMAMSKHLPLLAQL